MVILDPRRVAHRFVADMHQIGPATFSQFLVTRRLQHVKHLVHPVDILLGHVVGTRPRIGDHLMAFIERLRDVQRLLGRVAELRIRFPLQ
ncbi:hypothetical protein D3C81_1530410 [compost metagenome]